MRNDAGCDSRLVSLPAAPVAWDVGRRPMSSRVRVPPGSHLGPECQQTLSVVQLGDWINNVAALRVGETARVLDPWTIKRSPCVGS
jgi:hypothetical protein